MNEKKPVCSVVIPVYNNEGYIAEALDSVIRQTVRGIEIFVVDDGSSDGSGEIAKEYAAKDGRVRCIPLAQNNTAQDEKYIYYVCLRRKKTWFCSNYCIQEAALFDTGEKTIRQHIDTVI